MRSLSFTRRTLTICSGILLSSISIQEVRAANPASPKLDKWQTAKYNCFNHAQASKANRFEQIAGLNALLVFDQTKPAFTATNLTDCITTNYANFTSLGSPANPPATPANKSLVALVYNDTKGFDLEIALDLKLDGTGSPIPIPGMPGKFEKEIVVLRYPKADFHWYRLNDKNQALDTNNVWSDKPGEHDAKEFKNAGAYVTNPRTANRGGYNQFIGYYSIPEGNLANLRPGPDGAGTAGGGPGDSFDRPGPAARWGKIRSSGLSNILGDVADIDDLVDAIPTGSPISDPQWEPWYMTGSTGGDLVIPDLGLRSQLNIESMIVYQSVVEIHRPGSDLAEFFVDNNGLSSFLHTQVPEPSSAIAMLSCMIVGAVMRSRRRVSH